MATIVFVPYEIDELIKSVTALKVLALVINLAIASTCSAKRLFGLRGGGKAVRAESTRTPDGLLSSVPPPALTGAAVISAIPQGAQGRVDLA